MKLRTSEKRWLKAYREELERRFPDQVKDLSIYGSKARGESHKESDLDVLLIVNNLAVDSIPEMRRIGYLLAADGSAVPSVIAYTEKEWERRATSGSPFRKAVERDAVRVL